MRILFLFIAFAVAIAANAQQPAFKIAYNVLYDTATFNYEVFVMDADGSNKRNLSNYKGTDWVYLAQGNRLYFISDRDSTCPRCYKLYEADLASNQVRKVSDLVLEDSWMDIRKDGSEMIVSARQGRDIRMQLFLLNLRDGSYRQLTTDTAAYHADPVFSADDHEVAFRYRAKRRDREAKVELYIMNADGTGLRQLTSYPEQDKSANDGQYHAGPPKWNYNMNYITYMSFQNGEYQLYAVSPDGKKKWNISNYDKQPGWHDWSNDGRWLVVDMSVKGKKGFDIYLIDMQSGRRVQLTNDWRYEQAPVIVEN